MPFAELGSLRIAYQSFGSPGDPPLLLMSGLGAQMLQWPEPLCRALVRQGFQVIRFDHRDCGRSSYLDHLPLPDLRQAAAAWRGGKPLPPPYGIDDMAEDALRLMDFLTLQRAYFCGASVGGMVAQAAALRAPTRCLGLISIMSASSSLGLPVPTKIALSAYSTQPPANVEAHLRQSLQLSEVLAGPGFPVDREAAENQARETWARGIYPAGTARHLMAFYAFGDRHRELRSLRLPTRVIHGDADPLVPLAAGTRTAGQIPGARLLVFHGMGHDLPKPLWPHLARAIGTQIPQVG